MILQALEQHYWVLLDDENNQIAPPAYSIAKVDFAAVISSNGNLVELEDLRVNRGDKLISRQLTVPEQVIRTSGIASNFLCENASYFFGIPIKGDEKRSKEEYSEFKRYHESMLSNVTIQAVKALILFFKMWDAEKAVEHHALKNRFEDLKTGNIVFRLDGDRKYLHEMQEVKETWEMYRNSTVSQKIGQCLISGEKKPLAVLHQKIKGVVGSPSMGSAVVSFNKDAFTSYGKEQSLNAPISEEATFAYTTVINYLLDNDKNRVRHIGDTTAIFWAQKSTNGLEESIFSEIFDPLEEFGNHVDEKVQKRKPDNEAIRTIKSLLERLKNGQSIYDLDDKINMETDFFILGLAPNSSRLSIRFWQKDSFGKILTEMLQHQLDMEIILPEYSQPLVAPWKILKEAAAHKDSKNISPRFAGNLAKSIISGQLYGDGIYTAMLSRIRADRDVNSIRAGMIKACMIRKARKNGDDRKEASITVSLNLDNYNVGYRLGRLFAVMEKTQSEANSGLNSTIKDRYFGAASTTPGSVFPILMKLSQHHISKAEYGRFRDSQIGEIMETVETFPSHLNLEDQGQFILGYYHQKQSFYTKKINGGEKNEKAD